MIDGRAYTNFCGCGYLALSAVPQIRESVRRALDAGVPFAQPLAAAKGAVDPLFDKLEREIAGACHTEASVYFASGYCIGLVGPASIEDCYDVVFLDDNAHYNLKDAARLLARPAFTFSHCDAESLRTALRRHVAAGQRPLLMTDGVFPVSGRVPPLAQYAAELLHYDGRLFIDEAHSFGVIGTSGRGAAEYCGVEYLSTIGATLSKAYCAHGAFVACSAEAARRLRTIPVIRGACAGSPLSAVAATASLVYAARHPQLRTTLRERTDYLRRQVRRLGLDVIDSPAPIVSFHWGKSSDMQALQRRVFDRGILINYSSYVGAGREGTLVCAVFRDHTREDIDALIDALQ
jgi:7-keto-8-aminopelargonate synthetase-like enzyme